MSRHLGRRLSRRALAPREFQLQQALFDLSLQLQRRLRLRSRNGSGDCGQTVEVLLKGVLVGKQVLDLLLELLKFTGVLLRQQGHVLLVLLQDVTLALLPFAGRVTQLFFECLEFIFTLGNPLLLLLCLVLGNP